jgi:hypothetical protein
MCHYLYKLTPPRPSFAFDMSEAEGAIMNRHFAYWQSLFTQGRVVAYGPVLDPKGLYGIGLIEAENEAMALGVAAADPAIVANAGFGFEMHPLHEDAVIRR